MEDDLSLRGGYLLYLNALAQLGEDHGLFETPFLGLWRAYGTVGFSTLLSETDQGYDTEYDPAQNDLVYFARLIYTVAGRERLIDLAGGPDETLTAQSEQRSDSRENDQSALPLPVVLSIRKREIVYCRTRRIASSATRSLHRYRSALSNRTRRSSKRNDVVLNAELFACLCQHRCVDRNRNARVRKQCRGGCFRSQHVEANAGSLQFAHHWNEVAQAD